MADMTCGAFPVRMSDLSSFQITSRSQCACSTRQWPRTWARRSSGVASPAGEAREVEDGLGAGVPLAFVLVRGVPLDEQGLGRAGEAGAPGGGQDADGAGLDPAADGLAGRGGDGGVLPGQGVQGLVQVRLVAQDQEGDRLRRFRALLPCEVVVTALAHPLCGCRVRAYAFRHVDGVPHLKVELPDGMPGLVAADATDVFGAGPAAAGAGLVLDGAGLRHLLAVVTRLRGGDPAGGQR